MKIFKSSQNHQYLQSIGVPSDKINDILSYLLSLDDETRKKSVRRIRKNPNITLEELKIPVNKETYLKQQNVPQAIVDYAKRINPKYSVWIARELMKWGNLIKQWEEKRKKISEKYVETLHQGTSVDNPNNEKIIQLERQLDLVQNEIDPLTSEPYSHLNNLYKHPHGPYTSIMIQQEWSEIFDWAEQNQIDIMKVSLEEAKQQSEKWHEELAQKEKDESLKYKTHESVYKFPDGWEIVKLSPSDCSVEGDLMGHCVGGYSKRVEQGYTQIYSLRDKKNEPHATIEMTIPESPKEIDYWKIKNPSKNIEEDTPKYEEIKIQQIQGKGNQEPIDEYKEYIKQWFNSLKSQGYEFETMYVEEDVDVSNFHEFKNQYDEYGLKKEFDTIGGDHTTWFENLKDAYKYGIGQYDYFYKNETIDIFDELLQYAFETNQQDEFNKAIDSFSDWAQEDLDEFISLNYEYIGGFYPQEDDFITEYEGNQNQPEFDAEGFEETKIEVFDKDGYQKAVEEYEEKLDDFSQEHWPTQMSNYLIKEFNNMKAFNDMKQKAQQKVAISKMKIKIAEKHIPSAEEIASYVDALKIYLRKDKIKDKSLQKIIKNLPYPYSIRMHFSEEESKLVFESVAYVWKLITGKDLFEETKITNYKQGLEGNCWMILNGILMEGPNHFTIVKRNLSLFATLLNISPFVLHQKMASPPDELIKTIIANGGLRIFGTKDNKLYCQVSDETYSEWAREKIKKLDFKEKIVKVIDVSKPYNGWETGIIVKL